MNCFFAKSNVCLNFHHKYRAEILYKNMFISIVDNGGKPRPFYSTYEAKKRERRRINYNYLGSDYARK